MEDQTIIQGVLKLRSCFRCVEGVHPKVRWSRSVPPAVHLSESSVLMDRYNWSRSVLHRKTNKPDVVHIYNSNVRQKRDVLNTLSVQKNVHYDNNNVVNVHNNVHKVRTGRVKRYNRHARAVSSKRTRKVTN